MDVKVSIIMPVYNMVEYAKEAIKSILDQSFRDFELIIIDDASTDSLISVVRSSTDDRIIFLQNSVNIGNYPSRNRGIQIARGKYICVMDADDVAYPFKLETQFNYLEKHPDIVGIGSHYLLSINNQIRAIPEKYEDILVALLDNNCFLHSSLMFRAEAINKMEGYNEKYVYSSDYDLMCRMALYGKVENLSESLVIYRIHSSQISQKYGMEQRKYADEIRVNYQLAFVNRYKKQEQSPITISEVSYPDVGKAICLYTYADYSGKAMYMNLADKLLDDIWENVTVQTPVRDLCKLGCGILHLLRNGFVEGDEEEVLEDIDFALFNAIRYQDEENVTDWFIPLHYLRLRANGNLCDLNRINLLRIRQYLIFLLDLLVRDASLDFLSSRDWVKELQEIHKLGVCKEKTRYLLKQPVNEESSTFSITPLKTLETTFLIPLRIDSPERERNLSILLGFLNDVPNSTVLILEADKTPRVERKVFNFPVSYHFIQDSDPVFHRTKYINEMLHLSETEIVGVWDTDIIMPIKQILEAIEEIREGRAVMSFPYDGCFYTLSPEISAQFCKEQSISFLRSKKNSFSKSFGSYSVGGAFLVNKSLYLQAGGENENFYGWGSEDMERVNRMEILGLPVFRSKGPLFHLYHPRKRNSWFANTSAEIQNMKEFLKVSGMGKDELYQYIQSWNICR